MTFLEHLQRLSGGDPEQAKYVQRLYEAKMTLPAYGPGFLDVPVTEMLRDLRILTGFLEAVDSLGYETVKEYLEDDDA